MLDDTHERGRAGTEPLARGIHSLAGPGCPQTRGPWILIQGQGPWDHNLAAHSETGSSLPVQAAPVHFSENSQVTGSPSLCQRRSRSVRPPFLPSSTEQSTFLIPPPPPTKETRRQWTQPAWPSFTAFLSESQRLGAPGHLPWPLHVDPLPSPGWGQTTCRWRFATSRVPVS